MITRPRRVLRTSFTCVAFLTFLACSKQEAPAAAAPMPVTAETVAKLAAADALDGAVDKVVHRCAGCMLGMDGKAEFPLQVQDYTLHLCKQGCLDRLKADPAKEIAGLTVPAK
jgi:hypothetical protein